jgi:hypothetical protein
MADFTYESYLNANYHKLLKKIIDVKRSHFKTELEYVMAMEHIYQNEFIPLLDIFYKIYDDKVTCDADDYDKYRRGVPKYNGSFKEPKNEFKRTLLCNLVDDDPISPINLFKMRKEKN